jgi:hypothetical protein
LAVFTAGRGLKDFITGTAQSAQQLVVMAANIGMSASELDRWGKVMERAGGSGQAFKQNLYNLSNQLKDVAVNGQVSDQLMALQAMLARTGQQLDINADKTINWSKALPKIAQAAQSLPKGLADDLLRRAGFDAGAIAQMEQGSAALKTQFNQVKAISDEQIKQQAAVQRQITELKQDLGNAADQLFIAAAPAIKAVLQLLTRLADWVDAHPNVLGPLAVSALALQALITGQWIAGMLGAFARVGVGVDGLTLKFGALGKASMLALAAYGGWEAGTFISNQLKKTKTGREALDEVGDTWLKRLQWLGLAPDPEKDGHILSDKAKRRIAAGQLNHPANAANLGGAGTSALAQLISSGEGDYDSVNRGAAGGYRSGHEDLENMTLAQIMAAQQQHRFNAAGRYQIIGSTLREAVQSMGLTGSEKFDQKMQDRIFNEFLLKHQGPEIARYLAGKSGDSDAAGYNAAKEWASVAVPRGMRTESGAISDGAMTYYDDRGHNRASISAAQFRLALDNARTAQYAAMPAPGAGLALAARGAAGSSNTSNSTEVNINGPINIQTAATDANGIAREIGPAIRNNALVNQANTGLA